MFYGQFGLNLQLKTNREKVLSNDLNLEVWEAGKIINTERQLEPDQL